MTKTFQHLCLQASLCAVCSGQQVIDIFASGTSTNVETIAEIVMDVTTGGSTSTVVQSSPVTSTNSTASSAILRSISLGSTTLRTFNAITPTLANTDFDVASTVEVFTPSSSVTSTDPNFLTEVANMHGSGDLMQYIRVDGPVDNPKWDINYGGTSFNSNDYLIVEERNGNTTFTLQALDVNGNLISDANTLSFDANSYQWDIGYGNALDPNGASQTQVLSVLSLDLFDTTTPIGGFRINDTGNADIKVFVGSIPEPSVALLSGLSMFSLLARRQR